MTPSRAIQDSQRFMIRAASTGAMLCLAATLLTAQSYYGVVRGIVQDQNGGAIVSAKVSLINEGTNEARTILTKASGEYVFNEVVPATYSVVSEAPGFKKSENKGI